MRYTVLQIETDEERDYYRYSDVTPDFEEADIIDNNNYYSWKKNNNYQWYGEYRYQDSGLTYVIVFFETHPFFNCTMLIQYQKPIGISNYTHKASFGPCAAAEEWLYSLKKKRTRKKL